MKLVSSKSLTFLSLSILGLSIADIVNAICPICVVAVGAGLGLSRWFGVDDVVVSIWIGALLFALSIWTIVWLEKKKLVQLNATKPQSRLARLFNRVKNFKYNNIAVFAFYYLLTLVPLYYLEIIGHPLNKIWGIDKIIFGTVIGSIIFLLSNVLHKYLKNKNNGKSFFPYQKVVVPIINLLLISIAFYFLIKYKLI